MNNFGMLSGTGAAAILRRAGVLLDKRGWNKALHYDPSTGQVDLIGAIALAAGVKIKHLTDSTDPLGELVPPARQAAVMIAVEALQWACDAELVEWQAHPNRVHGDLLDALSRSATRLEIGLLSPGSA